MIKGVEHQRTEIVWFGELSTVVCTVNAGGNYLPPFIIFPRAKMKDVFMNGAPPEAKGVTAKSGWMNSEIFSREFLPSLIKRAKLSKEKPVLIMDNHESHSSLAAIDIARASGVVILTLPPHTSNKMQLLDHSIYAPMKS